MSLVDIFRMRSPILIAHAVLGYMCERRVSERLRDASEGHAGELADVIMHKRPRELARQLPV